MRIIIAIILIFCSSLVLAQNRKVRSFRNPFLSTQWYLGFYAGGNFTKGNPGSTYSGYAPLDYNPSNNEKSYSGFTKIGPQAGLVFMFYTSGFTIAIKPGVHSYSISHSTAASWVESSTPLMRFK